VWHSDFFGLAVLMNKQSAEHLDTAGLPHAWDAILASGEFTGGDMFFKDANVQTAIGPGDLALFDGTVQRHAVLPFEGPQRMSHVFFVHRSV
ncbi:hypothetical protein BDV93DRAFT_414862, partial [Ceratobasidium sp. AG-I]